MFHIQSEILLGRTAIFCFGMWDRKAVALWAVFCCGVACGAESFTIHSGAATTSRTEVRYFLTGVFGGYGAFVREADEDGAYRIPLAQDGKLAKTVKAILYAPGCQFSLISMDLTTPTRSATFECRRLSTITLNGRISPPPSRPSALDVEIRYQSLWGLKFFGLLDGGIVQQFSVGKAPLLAGGRFQIEIPDFSKDGVTQQMQDAYLQVLVIEHSTWNIVEEVLPQADQQYRNIGLKIGSDYGSEVAFTGR